MKSTEKQCKEENRGDFLKLLCLNSPPLINVRAVADYLRSSKASLVDLGVGPIMHEVAGGERPPWKQLRKCLNQAASDHDALVIFRVMAQHLVGHPLRDCAPIMVDVLQRPWRLRAIKAAPNFFRLMRHEDDAMCIDLDHRAADAFQALAIAGVGKRFSRNDALAAIQALKDLGVRGQRHPGDGTVCLHLAARFHTPEALDAFVQEFPQELEQQDNLGSHPLHGAAFSHNGSNLKVLLNAGAHPRPVSHNGETPMQTAAQRRCLDGVIALLDTGAYSDDDVDRALEFFTDDESQQYVRVYHAAVKARQAVVTTASCEQGLPKPL